MSEQPEPQHIISFAPDHGWFAHFSIHTGPQARTWTLPIIGWAVVATDDPQASERATKVEALVFDGEHSGVTIAKYCSTHLNPRYKLDRTLQHPSNRPSPSSDAQEREEHRNSWQ